MATSLPDSPHSSSGAPPHLLKEEKAKAVTWRSVLACLILLPANAYWVVQMEVVRYSAHPTTIALFFNIIFILLVLTLLNRQVRKFSPKLALSRAELLFIYSVLAIGSCLCGHDMIQVLVPSLCWLARDNSDAQRWNDLFGARFPKWCMVNDVDAVKGYFRGNDSIYRPENLHAWLPVVLIWSFIIATLLFTMLCINAILRKQWTENERLSYPLVQLPLQITSEQAFTKSGMFYNWLFYAGFFVAFSIDLINSLNVYFPSIPTVFTPGRGQSFFNANDWVTAKPWNAIGWTPLSFYPFIIGLGMLMPVDFLFSCWFFYLFWKMEHVITVMMAWDQDPRFPYDNNQAFGAYFAFCVFSLYLSRGYLRDVLKKVLGRPSPINDEDEPIRYRGAFLGIFAGMAVLVLFSNAIGMGYFLPIIFFIIYFALALAITRMRAELGTPIHDLHFTGPDWILAEVYGQRGSFTPGQLVGFTLYYWFNRAYRSHPMPHQLEAFKMAEQTRSEFKKWFWGLAAFGFIGAVVAFWAVLQLMYSYGASAKSAMTFGPEAYTRMETWVKTPKNGSFSASIAIAVGFLMVLFLQWMRIRFIWWPFHPLAFALTSSWEINLVWLPLFLAWLTKVCILRYGGRGGFQRSIPFFMGLIIGQFVLGSLLNIYGIIMQVPTYQFWQ